MSAAAVALAPTPRFELPDTLIADAPAEARGLARDAVRLLVTSKRSSDLVDAVFRDLPDFLDAGDLVVVNTSATVPAAVPTTDGRLVHFSTELPGGLWVVEVRQACGAGSVPSTDARDGEVIPLCGGGAVQLLSRYPIDGPPRLWTSIPYVPGTVLGYLNGHGRPIRYGCPDRAWPIDAYQTAFGVDPGSAEMPSASRGFTPEIVTRLVTKGVGVTPITLHCGVSSQEAGEPPYPERFAVPTETARRVNDAHDGGHSVIAIGTTVTRALETVADDDGRAHPGSGWTEHVVTPERGVRVVDGIVTGWHEPEASHLQLLEAIAGPELLDRSYSAALDLGYQWHEFGDTHLVLP
jgi:S-adenosylmethionine:tRNA ribosyltransferase-isomerase